MLSIDINHPDVAKFATIKSDLTKVTGANISIRVNDEFMKAVENDEDYILRWPCDKEIDEEIAFRHPYNESIIGEWGSVTKKIKAKELWDTIIEQARNNAEPGVMFWDNVMKGSPDSVYEEYRPVSSNPCGEQFLQPYDSCRLMCLNLFSFVNDPFTDDAEIDYDKLYQVAYEQQRLMDDLVDLEIEHVDRIIEKIENDPQDDLIKGTELQLWKNIRQTAQSGRRTGSGITALGDMLAAIGVKYDSDEGLEVVEKVMSTKMRGELDCTIDLAILRGKIEGWDPKKEFGTVVGYKDTRSVDIKTIGNDFYLSLIRTFPEQASRMIDHGRRNISWSTIAPTGSVSILTGTSSGCEPLFMPFYMRRKKVNPDNTDVRVDFVDQNGDSWQEFAVLHPKFKDWCITAFGLNETAQERLNDKDTLQNLFTKSPWYGATANDIDWKKRVEMQAVLQKYTTNAISTTLNLPEDTTTETVSEIYLHSWKQGLKGQTVYREGSRSGVLVNIDNKQQKTSFEYHDAPKRPLCLPVDIHTTVSKGVKWNVIVGLFDGRPYEVFAVPYFTNETSLELCKVKKGRYDLLRNGETYSEDITSQITDEQDVLTRMVSTALRHGADITFIVEQLNKSHGDITSFSKAIARTLKKYIDERKMVSRATCTECGSNNLVFEEGCLSCKDCGSSKCG
jgi:ribonucleoside-diphosphate reductase alpha chain